MEKTKKFIEDQFKKYDDLYWEWQAKLDIKHKEFNKLQNEFNNMRDDVHIYNMERIQYQELLNEFKEESN